MDFNTIIQILVYINYILVGFLIGWTAYFFYDGKNLKNLLKNQEKLEKDFKELCDDIKTYRHTEHIKKEILQKSISKIPALSKGAIRKDSGG